MDLFVVNLDYIPRIYTLSTALYIFDQNIQNFVESYKCIIIVHHNLLGYGNFFKRHFIIYTDSYLHFISFYLRYIGNPWSLDETSLVDVLPV